MKRTYPIERVERVRSLLAQRARHELVVLTARMAACRRAAVELQRLGGVDTQQRYRAGILGSRMEMAEQLHKTIAMQAHAHTRLAKQYEVAEASYQQIKRSADRQREARVQDDAMRAAAVLDAMGLANWHWRKSR